MLSNWENTPAATLLRFLADLMLVNLLLLCCSLGMVTIGAALTGMYAVLFKRQREDGSVSVLKTFSVPLPTIFCGQRRWRALSLHCCSLQGWIFPMHSRCPSRGKPCSL